ncbi:ABC transporter ATP-binding protein [Candidatus Halobeggiatoa sp. HSG11]|nr:ABC transporter ATP-binding protein [Candidatus Halobeggiatoa sp. HSG11]
MSTIFIEQVFKRFKNHIVLDNINLQVQANEHIALIGSNGAGKTTLMRCLLGEYNYDGLINVNDLNPRQNRQTILKRIGFVPQLPPPLKMPVGQLIKFAAGVCDTNPSNIIDITKQLGLDIQTFIHRPFNKLSGGQKQKLLIGIALGRNSDILIMDEPAANLDPEAREIFLKLLKAERAITLISSHRLNEITTLVNRVIELDMGKIIVDKKITN